VDDSTAGVGEATRGQRAHGRRHPCRPCAGRRGAGGAGAARDWRAGGGDLRLASSVGSSRL